MLYKVDVRGDGALTASTKRVARDLTKVKPGRIAYGPVFNDDGMMLDDSTCFVYGDDHVRVIGGGSMPHAIDSCNDEKELECALDARGALPPHGAGTAQPRRARLPGGHRHVKRGVPVLHLPGSLYSLAGIAVMIARMGFTAELGYEVLRAARTGARSVGRDLSKPASSSGFAPWEPPPS